MLSESRPHFPPSRRVAAYVASGIMLLVTGSGCGLYFGDGDDAASGQNNGRGNNHVCPKEKPSILKQERFPTRPALEIGPTVTADPPPPPLAGGTLAISADQSTAVAADADRDRVYLVTLATGILRATIALADGDEPGRVAIDNANRAHIALRRGGAIATLDLQTGTLARRSPVCAAPRGVAFNHANNQLVVACYGGEVVTLHADSGQVIRQTRIDKGLRDVVIRGSTTYVSVFRTAEVLVIDSNGIVTERLAPPVLETEIFDPSGEVAKARFVPGVAWRTVAAPNGGVLMLHQRARKGTISTGAGGYGGNTCSSSVVHAAITHLKPATTPIATQAITSAVLPVDLAMLWSENEAVMVAAGNNNITTSELAAVTRAPVNQPHDFHRCHFDPRYQLPTTVQPVAVATTGDVRRTVVVQSRHPATLFIYPNDSQDYLFAVPLSNDSRNDTGHTIFHMNTGANVACASCHPEGGEDAQVWNFECVGPRRTQSLRFGLRGTEPLHWDGDMDSLDTLMNQVFVGRMAGGVPRRDQLIALGTWLNGMRPPPSSPASDPVAVERGRQLFANPTVGCQSCHSGNKFTDNRSYDVGTGQPLQVPSLIGLANRAPYMHTGCAATLHQRFSRLECGGGDKHGFTSTLSTQEIDDLVAYLETL